MILNDKFFILLSVALVLSFTACQADDESAVALLNALQQESIVDDDLQLIDEVLMVDAGILPSKT